MNLIERRAKIASRLIKPGMSRAQAGDAWTRSWIRAAREDQKLTQDELAAVLSEQLGKRVWGSTISDAESKPLRLTRLIEVAHALGYKATVVFTPLDSEQSTPSADVIPLRRID